MRNTILWRGLLPWLQSLPIRRLNGIGAALREVYDRGLFREGATTLTNGFIWRATPQGAPYWSALSDEHDVWQHGKIKKEPKYAKVYE